jgi:hypothetical protein
LKQELAKWSSSVLSGIVGLDAQIMLPITFWDLLYLGHAAVYYIWLTQTWFGIHQSHHHSLGLEGVDVKYLKRLFQLPNGEDVEFPAFLLNLARTYLSTLLADGTHGPVRRVAMILLSQQVFGVPASDCRNLLSVKQRCFDDWGEGQIPRKPDTKWVGERPEGSGPRAVAAQEQIELLVDEYTMHLEFGSNYNEKRFADRFRFDETCEGASLNIGAALVAAVNSHAKHREDQGEYGQSLDGIESSDLRRYFSGMGPFPRTDEDRDAYVERLVDSPLCSHFDNGDVTLASGGGGNPHLEKLYDYWHDDRITRLFGWAEEYLTDGDPLFTASLPVGEFRTSLRPCVPSWNQRFTGAQVWKGDDQNEPIFDNPEPGQAAWFDAVFCQWIVTQLKNHTSVNCVTSAYLQEGGSGDLQRCMTFMIPREQINNLPLLPIDARPGGPDRDHPENMFSGTSTVVSHQSLATGPFVRMKVYREQLVTQRMYRDYLDQLPEFQFDEPWITEDDFRKTKAEKYRDRELQAQVKHYAPVTTKASWPCRNYLPLNPRRDPNAEGDSYGAGVPFPQLCSLRLQDGK